MNKHDNLSFIYPFPCKGDSLKWQGLKYDLQLEWSPISHHFHPQIRQWMRGSGKSHPPSHLLSLFNLPHSCPRGISFFFDFPVPHFNPLLILTLTYLCLVPIFLMSFFLSPLPMVASLQELQS